MGHWLQMGFRITERMAMTLMIGAVAVAASSRAAAHGARIESTLTRAVRVELSVEIRASYHSERPMAGAQVSVFAPGGSESAWLVGQCDEEGVFVFEPDQSLVGTWQARVLLRGHGGVVRFEVGEAPGESIDGVLARKGPQVADQDDGAADRGAVSEGAMSTRVEASSEPHLSTLQRLLMGGCVVWGLVGTALFFARRRH